MTSSHPLSEGIHAEALELFRALVRLDTTNPPGREKAAAELLADKLTAEGVECRLLVSGVDRGNMVARLKGDGSGPPLLLTAHLDVVPAEHARWRHPPFAAEIDDGWLFGRGTVDMKNMAAMSATVLLALRRAGVPLRRDLIFAAVADEEAGCDHGSKFLVNEHADLVRAEYALGEIGGFTQPIQGRRVYPIQVAQKGAAWVRATTVGTAGHGSMPREDNAVLTLARAVARLSPGALPVHVSPSARRFIERLAAALPLPSRAVLPLLLQPALTDMLLSRLPDAAVARAIGALLRNTATPTVLRAGVRTNVIPGSAEAEIDARFVPGQRVDDLLSELRAVLGEGVRLSVQREIAATEASPDTPLFAVLEKAVRWMDGEGIPVPSMIPGFTDAAHFARLGTTYYGFSPIWFPASPPVSFSDLYHGDDERIPVEGFHRGLDALHFAVHTWCVG